LAMEPIMKGIPLDDDDLLPVLVNILKTEFGATDKKAEGLFSKLRAKISGSK
jgi:hypothetical protein